MTKSIEGRIQKAVLKRSIAVCRAEFEKAVKASPAGNQPEKCTDINAVQLSHVKIIASKNTPTGENMPGDNDKNVATVAELLADLTSPAAKGDDSTVVKLLKKIVKVDQGVDNTLVQLLKQIVEAGHGGVSAIKIYTDPAGKESFAVQYNLLQYLPKKK